MFKQFISIIILDSCSYLIQIRASWTPRISASRALNLSGIQQHLVATNAPYIPSILKQIEEWHSSSLCLFDFLQDIGTIFDGLRNIDYQIVILRFHYNSIMLIWLRITILNCSKYNNDDLIQGCIMNQVGSAIIWKIHLWIFNERNICNIQTRVYVNLVHRQV